jgi:hypothetical protein
MQLSWKVILAPIFGAFFGWLASHGIDLTPDQQASFGQLFVAGGATVVTFLGHFWHEKTQADAAPAAGSGKQGGWASLGFLAALLTLVVMCLMMACLMACATLSFDEDLASAYTAHTAVVNAATQAVTAGTLSSTQGQQVLTMAQSSRALLDAAKAAETAGNASGASNELQLASSALSALQTFVNSEVKK